MPFIFLVLAVEEELRRGDQQQIGKAWHDHMETRANTERRWGGRSFFWEKSAGSRLEQEQDGPYY